MTKKGPQGADDGQLLSPYRATILPIQDDKFDAARGSAGKRRQYAAAIIREYGESAMAAAEEKTRARPEPPRSSPASPAPAPH